MSILIKGMEMPQRCKECDLFIEGACYAKGYRDYRSIMDMAKPADCPLIEVPTPHGRLIDADAIQYTHAIARSLDDGHNWNELCVTQDEIEDAPTVIEAEAMRT